MNDNARKWIEALRSGEYKQTRSVLSRPGGGHCCLGVACDLAAKEGVVTAVEMGSLIAYDENEYLLPESVKNWLGLINEDGAIIDDERGEKHLPDLNDSFRWSFARIADYIEEHAAQLFVAEETA